MALGGIALYHSCIPMVSDIRSDALVATIEASHQLKAKRLGFITPYVPEVLKRMHRHLTDAEFESFEESNDRTVARISETSIILAIEQIAGAALCDATVISCTKLRTLNILKETKQKIGVPIFSSNSTLVDIWCNSQISAIRCRFLAL